jgi:hypothetical protein
MCLLECKRHKWSSRSVKRVKDIIDKAALAEVVLCSLLISSLMITLMSSRLVVTQGQNIQTLAPNNSSSGYSSYKNREYGFELSYPSQWQKTEFAEGIERNGRKIVTNFLSPPEGGSDKFRAYIMIEVSDFQPNDLLSDYVKQQIVDYEKLYPGFKLVESLSLLSNIPSNRSVSEQGNVFPESKIVFTYDDPLAGTVKILERYYQDKDQLYIWSLHSEATNYGTYLPIMQKMVDSFHPG